MKRILLLAVLVIGAPSPVLGQAAGERTVPNEVVEQEIDRLERELADAILRERIMIVLVLIVGVTSIAMWVTGGKKAPPRETELDVLRLQRDREMTTLEHEVEVAALERDLAEAILHSDTATLGRLFADDLILTTISGRVLNKAQAIAEFENARYWSFKNDDVVVNVYGDVAVVTGRTMRGGQTQRIDVSAQYRFTRVYVWRQGRPQIITSQATHIAPQ